MTNRPPLPPERTASDWADWFWGTFLEDWLARVQDGDAGVFDALALDGTAQETETKTLLAQARTLFTLSHAALLTGNPTFRAAAGHQAIFLNHFRKAKGLYRCNANRDGSPTGDPADEVARSYDQTFVILGLVTWYRVSPSDAVLTLIEECWEALREHLTDPSTGLLRNDDTGAHTGPAQNPHMHLFEACLQAYRMTNAAVWLERASTLRTVGLRFFMDLDSGSIAEFLTPDLRPLSGEDGQRREIGHQCEWAWLLFEEADLANDRTLAPPAVRLTSFAEAFGFATTRPLAGAAYDAVSAKGDVTENSFLLWPQTEAIKLFAIRHTAGDPDAGPRACTLLVSMFEHWFQDHPMFINQLDSQGTCIWPQGLTRLMYHVILAISEGSRAGLWPEPAKSQS